MGVANYDVFVLKPPPDIQLRALTIFEIIQSNGWEADRGHICRAMRRYTDERLNRATYLALTESGRLRYRKPIDIHVAFDWGGVATVFPNRDERPRNCIPLLVGSQFYTIDENESSLGEPIYFVSRCSFIGGSSSFFDCLSCVDCLAICQAGVDAKDDDARDRLDQHQQ